jgi:hypothetical protein
MAGGYSSQLLKHLPTSATMMQVTSRPEATREIFSGHLYHKMPAQTDPGAMRSSSELCPPEARWCIELKQHKQHCTMKECVHAALALAVISLMLSLVTVLCVCKCQFVRKPDPMIPNLWRD